MKDVLIIGGASLDTLHLASQTVASAGGAGMYTAAAAHRMGATVSMFAPRPKPMPEALHPLDERVKWLGPAIPPEQLPRFEIAYQADQAIYRNMFFGAEATLSPIDLPADLSGYRYIHIVPLGDADRQLAFLEACRNRGAKHISVGTYVRGITDKAPTVEALTDQADFVFMNEAEATILFGALTKAKIAPGKLLFVTLGKRGVLIVQGDYHTFIDAPNVREVDPTGAGDTFCGATLAGLAHHLHPIQAARQAVTLAARTVQLVGPEALWDTSSPFQKTRNPRVVLNQTQIKKVANLIAGLSTVQAFDHTGEDRPPINDSTALDFFFALTLQQFSFWEAADGHYLRPLLAPLGGEIRKGSDYLTQAYLRAWRQNPEIMSPARQAALTRAEMLAVFRADDGTDPMPAFDLHLDLAHAYGKTMRALNLTPTSLLDAANATTKPLAAFMQQLSHIGGYREDPLQKKSALLAVILSERPERFLRPAQAEEMPPIIDYHLMRSCLRVGLIDIVDLPLRQALMDRRLVNDADELAVRQAAYNAILEVTRLSGKSMAAVDWFFFNARRRCPEMTDPECAACAVDPVCRHDKALFQPVLRTTFY